VVLVKHVKADYIKDHFEGKEVGVDDDLQGRLDGVNFATIAMQDAGCISRFMSTYGTLDITD
jgi:hypothetical protein